MPCELWSSSVCLVNKHYPDPVWASATVLSNPSRQFFPCLLWLPYISVLCWRQEGGLPGALEFFLRVALSSLYCVLWILAALMSLDSVLCSQLRVCLCSFWTGTWKLSHGSRMGPSWASSHLVAVFGGSLFFVAWGLVHGNHCFIVLVVSDGPVNQFRTSWLEWEDSTGSRSHPTVHLQIGWPILGHMISELITPLHCLAKSHF